MVVGLLIAIERRTGLAAGYDRQQADPTRTGKSTS